MTSVEIDVQSVKQLIDSGSDFLLLDCRKEDEYQHCRIEGSTHIPMGEIPDRVAELAEFQDRTIVVHCHHGIRSLKVANWLRDRGFEKTQSMHGGIESWSLEIDPLVPRY